MTVSTVPALVLRRVYDVPRERLYQAWTDPTLAKEFLCPEGVTISEVSMDVRVGGEYRIVMQHADEALPVSGVYREVRPPERLSMTWTWEEDEGVPTHETLLTLEFNVMGSGSELVLTHERLASVESRDRHTEGWNSILDKFAELK